MNKTQITYLLLIFLGATATVGCGSPHSYVHPSPGFDRIKKIAVMPFDNFTKDEKAGDKVRTNIVIELLRLGSFDVMDTGETDRMLQRKGLSYSSTSGVAPPAISIQGAEGATTTPIPLSQQIGDALNVEALLIGSVQAYDVERVADQIIPEVSISVRLVDTETGIIIWATNHTRRGSMGFPVFGWGKVTSLSVLSQQVIQDMAHSLAKYLH